MAVTAFLFPGQGSQVVGMASILAQNSKIAKDILSEIDDALGFKLSTLMAEGPSEDLQLTQNAQPALFASSICTLRVLQHQTGKTISELCSFVAGTLWVNIRPFVRLAVWAFQKRHAFYTFVASPCSRLFLWVKEPWPL